MKKNVCVFCSGKFKISDVNSENLDYFDDNPDVWICDRHIDIIHNKIARGEI
jgi:hypothetical protein